MVSLTRQAIQKMSLVCRKQGLAGLATSLLRPLLASVVAVHLSEPIGLPHATCTWLFMRAGLAEGCCGTLHWGAEHLLVMLTTVEAIVQVRKTGFMVLSQRLQCRLGTSQALALQPTAAPTSPFCVTELPCAAQPFACALTC